MIKQSKTHRLANQLGAILLKRKIRLSVAESCTGGSLAAAITDIPGSSQWFDRAFVTYSHAAKEQMLGVSHHTLSLQGEVSEATVRAMAHGVMTVNDADVSVAITGIAGPDGGSAEKPVGTVWMAWAGDLRPTDTRRYFFEGDRVAVRQQAIQVALEGLIKRCDPKTHPQVQYKGPNRYFFALWPNEKIAKALHRRAKQVLASYQCSPVALENLHITLVYLGRVHPDFLQQAKRIASQQHSSPFELRITETKYWSRSKIRWFSVEKKPPELDALVNHLNQSLITAGFKPEKSLFTPHVTIARKLTQKSPVNPIAPLSWLVSDFCLVKSCASARGSRYEIIARWPLQGAGQ